MRTIRFFISAAAAAAALGPIPIATSVAFAQDENTKAARVDPAEEAAAKAVQRHIDAYRSGSLSQFIATFAPDAVVTLNGVSFQGHAALRESYAPNFTMNMPAPRVIESGWTGSQIYLWTISQLPDGSEIRAYEVYTVSGGLIARVDISI